MESLFGIPRNNESEPDFPQAGVELKTIPLLAGKQRLRVKERTSISIIDYVALEGETWTTATVRKKIGQVLFVAIRVGPDIRDYEVRDVFLWRPSPEDLRVFEADWTAVWRKVHEGRAHEISERDALYLSPARKGQGKGKDWRTQPRSTQKALQRAFTLKPSFTRHLLHARAKKGAVSLDLHLTSVGAFEEIVLSRLHRWEGRTIRDIAAETGLRLTGGKHLAAHLLRRALGVTDLSSPVAELEKSGLTPRILNAKDDLSTLFEGTSFRAIRFREFVEEDWEGAELREHLDYILFLPTLSPRRGTPQADRVLGRAFFWRPSEEQWTTIEEEWRMFQERVRETGAGYRVDEKGKRHSLLPTASQTRIVHIRPHGADSDDEAPDGHRGEATKQSFWLNPAFTLGLLQAHGQPPDAAPARPPPRSRPETS